MQREVNVRSGPEGEREREKKVGQRHLECIQRRVHLLGAHVVIWHGRRILGLWLRRRLRLWLLAHRPAGSD